MRAIFSNQTLPEFSLIMEHFYSCLFKQKTSPCQDHLAMARESSKFCIFYCSNNLNYLELNLYILWFIFWSYTGCQNLTLAVSITIGLISILIFEIYGLIKKSMSLVRISFIFRCIQILTALGLLIFVMITEVDIINEEKFPKWWKFTYGTRLILGCLLTVGLIYYFSKAVLQFKIIGMISQENVENLPTTHYNQGYI